MKETAGFVDFLSPRDLIFVQSEGNFNQEWKGAEDEFTFGIGFAVSRQIRVGGTWSFLRGRPQRIITGTFHDTYIEGFEGLTIRTDTTLEEGIQENVSGNYGKLGFLFIPHPQITIGAAARLPYTRKSEITIARTGTIATDNQASRPFEEGATAEARAELPATWSVGGSVWIRKTSRVAGSVTFGDWSDLQ
ncbi:MAG TPA: hypothetical protein VJ521_13775, partial [Acidobacteriota bacterium]|nr:hypothetical protein [Acidobacteriota bacterium]